MSAFARRFTAGRALFAGDDARDGGETDGASSARARRRSEPAEIVRIDVMGRAQYYPGAPPVRERPTPACSARNRPSRDPFRKPLTPRSDRPLHSSSPRVSPLPPAPSSAVSAGDRVNGYPDMTVRQLCDALDARYASRKLPAERHVQQLVAKVATADDATTAAAAMAKFHHRRAAAFASMKLPRKRHGLTPQSLMMFIGACHRVGATRLALASAENHNAMGLPMIKPALLKLCEACEDVDQVLRVYNLWRKEGWEVDASIAEAVVMAAARVGEADAAGKWLAEFEGAGIDSFDAAKCETAVADKRAEMAEMPDDDGGEENGGEEEGGDDAEGESESK